MLNIQYYSHRLLQSKYAFIFKLTMISIIYFLFLIGKSSYCMGNGDEISIVAEKNDTDSLKENSNNNSSRDSLNSDDSISTDEGIAIAHREAAINYFSTYDESIAEGYIQSVEQQLAEIPADEKLQEAINLLEEKSREYYDLNQKYYESQLIDNSAQPKQVEPKSEIKELEKQTDLLTLAQNAFDEAEGALPKIFYDAISDYADDLEKASTQYAEQIKKYGQLKTNYENVTRENLHLKDQVQDTETLQEKIANLEMRAYNLEQQFNEASNDHEKEITELKNRKSYYKNKLKELNPDETLSVDSNDNEILSVDSDDI